MKTLITFVIIVAGLIAYLLLAKDPPAPPSYKPAKIPAPEGALEYPPKGAYHHGEGLYSQTVAPAIDDQALRAYDIVEITYSGWTLETGENFDSSKISGQALRRRVDFGGKNKLIQGWMRVVPEMKLGETRRIWIPKELAYGANPDHHLANNTLIFDLTIESVDRYDSVPDISRHPEEPNQETKQLTSGLQYLSIEKPEQGARPKADDNVVVTLTIWNKEGEIVRSTDSSGRGKLQLAIDHAIPAVNEALQLMTVGETARFWVPQALGYGDKLPLGFPEGDWIMDLSLLSISKPFEELTPPREKQQSRKLEASE